MPIKIVLIAPCSQTHTEDAIKRSQCSDEITAEANLLSGSVHSSAFEVFPVTQLV